MNHLYFWKSWKTSVRYLYHIILCVCLLVASWYGYAWHTGTNDVIETVLESKVDEKKVVLENTDYHFLSLPMDVSMYYMTHFFRGSTMKVNLTANILYTCCVAFSFVLLMSVATFLSRTWYIVLMAFFILYLVSVNLDLLHFMGKKDRTLLVIFMLSYLPISYYFHSIENRISLLGRFLCFLVITLVLAWVTYHYSEISNPAMFFNGFGLAVPLVLSALFITINAHEIVSGIFYLVSESSSASSRHTSIHFLVFAGIYILNLVYIFFHQIKFWDWGILYFNPFLLLFITLLLGIWGFKKREIFYQNIGQHAPYGAMFYGAMAILTLATCAYAMATGNDAITEVFEDVIVFTHLAFGIGFIAYAMFNFYDYLSENKKAHRVIYMPHRVGYGMTFIIGIAISIILILRTNQFTYRQAVAGYYNAVADIYQIEKDTLLTQKYYENALGYEYQNHKGNYSMGSILLDQQTTQKATMFFKNALLKQPSEHSFLTLARIYDRNDAYFKSIHQLQRGLVKYPKSGKLASNLAMLYNRMQLPDSTFIYFDLARQHLDHEEKQIAEANFYAFWLKNASSEIKLDSILTTMGGATDIRKKNNEIVLQTYHHKPLETPLNFKYLPDSVLETIDLSYLYNYALNQAPKGDTSILKYLKHYENVSQNIENGFDDYLKLAQFFTLYYAHDYLKAHQIIKYLARYEAKNKSYYNRILGTFLLKNRKYEMAIKAFKKSYLGGDVWSGVCAAFLLSEHENKTEATNLWQDLTIKGDSLNQKLAQKMLRVLQYPSALQASELDSEGLYYYLHFYHHKTDNQQFSTYLESLKDNFKTKIIIDRIDHLIKTKNWEQIPSLRQSIKVSKNMSKKDHDRLIFLDLQLNYAQKNIHGLQEILAHSDLSDENMGYQTFYKAYIHEEKNSSKSEKLYRIALRQIPFEPQVAIQFANFYNRQKNADKAYDILVQNLRQYHGSERQPVQLLMAYAQQSAKMGYDKYLEETLTDLENVMQKSDFIDFKNKIKKIQTIHILPDDNF